MKVSIDLTEDKGFDNGIPIYIKNLLTNCHQHEYCGGAFAGIEYSKQQLKKQLESSYYLSKAKVKKYLTIERVFQFIKIQEIICQVR